MIYSGDWNYSQSAVAATDTFLALIGAHQRGTAVELINRENLRLKNPLLPKSSLSSASSTKHTWELLAGNRTAVPPRHAWGRWITNYQ